MNDNQPELSVIIVVGDCRERAERMLAAISMQSAADHIELVVVDAAHDGTRSFATPSGLRTKHIRVPPGILPGKARFEGVKAAIAPIIAFLEDHCFPSINWASSIIEAHAADWTAVGYSFMNGSPDRYLYRAVFLAEYGQWAHPGLEGEIYQLPGSNVSFKKKTILQFGDRLAGLFEMEYLLHENLRNSGSKFFMESRALVSHESYANFWELLYCHFLFSRLQAARRESEFSWGITRRVFMSLAVPVALPWIQLYRAYRVLRTHCLYKKWLCSIPVIYLIHQCEAIGESLGLLAGEGNSSSSFAVRELNSARIAKQPQKIM